MRTTDEESISEQAAEWFLSLPTAAPEQQQEFAQWLKKSPLHVNEFLLMTALHRSFEGFDPQKELAIEANPEARVIPFNESSPTFPSTTDTFGATHQPWRIGLAVAFGVAVLSAWWIWGPQSGVQHYSTDIGEQRAIEMSDGSVIHLNTHSQVDVTYTEQARQVRLLRGQALFRVARDSARPFRVFTERTAIQALGTQFDVYRHAAGDTTISVLEGKVRIDQTMRGQMGGQKAIPPLPAVSAPSRGSSSKSEPIAAPEAQTKLARAKTNPPTDGDEPAVLTAGEQVRISLDGEVTPARATDVQEMSVWRQRRLVFRKQTLAEVAEEFNRYNNDIRIQVIGEASVVHLTGVFDADDPHSLLQFLAADTNLRLSDQGATLVIQPR